MFTDTVVIVSAGWRWYGWRDSDEATKFKGRSASEVLGKIVQFYAEPGELAIDITGPAGGRLLHKPEPYADAEKELMEARYAPTNRAPAATT